MERSDDEQKWLEVIAKAEFPVTVIWGVYDTVSPPRVANYVWREYLMQRPSRNRLYYIPDANHYSQVDRPDAYAQVVLDALDADADQQLGFLGENRPAAPLLVDISRERIPVASDLLPAKNPNTHLGGHRLSTMVLLLFHSSTILGKTRRNPVPFRPGARSGMMGRAIGQSLPLACIFNDSAPSLENPGRSDPAI